MFSLLSEMPNVDSHRVTRAAQQNLLVIPFLPGPAGWCTMSFVASVTWNERPSSHARDAFLASLRSAHLAFSQASLSIMVIDYSSSDFPLGT